MWLKSVVVMGPLVPSPMTTVWPSWPVGPVGGDHCVAGCPLPADRGLDVHPGEVGLQGCLVVEHHRVTDGRHPAGDRRRRGGGGGHRGGGRSGRSWRARSWSARSWSPAPSWWARSGHRRRRGGGGGGRRHPHGRRRRPAAASGCRWARPAPLAGARRPGPGGPGGGRRQATRAAARRPSAEATARIRWGTVRPGMKAGTSCMVRGCSASRAPAVPVAGSQPCSTPSFARSRASIHRSSGPGPTSCAPCGTRRAPIPAR